MAFGVVSLSVATFGVATADVEIFGAGMLGAEYSVPDGIAVIVDRGNSRLVRLRSRQSSQRFILSCGGLAV